MKKFPTLALKLKVAKVAGKLPRTLTINHRIAPQAQSTPRKVSKP